MSKYYNFYFTTNFINSVDNILKNEYSKFLPRLAYYKFFHLINVLSGYNKDYDGASIHNSKLRSFIGKKKKNGNSIYISSLIIEKCVEHGIIGYTNYHVNQKNPRKNFTRKYYFTDSIKNIVSDSFAEIEIDNRTRKILEKEYKRPSDRSGRKQYDLFHSESFDFDFRSANKWITEQENISKHKYLILMSSVRRLGDRHISIVKDQKTKRIFTNLTLMKKELREYITIDGEKIKGVDMKSSQPFLLAHLILRSDKNNVDYNNFYNDVVKKDIYNHFQELWIEFNGSSKYETYDNETKEVIVCDIDDRKKSKREFMRMMYKKSNGSVPYQQVLKHYYPQVYTKLNELKKKYSKNIDENLAVHLQKLEASLFIPFSNTLEKCFTCHDSVYVKESEANRTKDFLKKYLDENGYVDSKLEIE